jgi:hypothetical protein
MPNNIRQAGVYDPILTAVVQGYANQQFVGMNLFPEVPVNKSTGQVIEFGLETYQQHDTRRSPGGSTNMVEFGFAGRPFMVEIHGLETPVPEEVARDQALVMPGLADSAEAVLSLMEIHKTQLEIQQAGIALNPANYSANHKVTLTGADKWSDPTSKPLVGVEAYKEAIRMTSGKYPNVMVLSAKAFAALKANDAVQARFMYTNSDSLTTSMLANYFGIEKVFVGESVLSTKAGDFADIWGTDVVMSYVAPAALRSRRQPSNAYTYTLRGHPFVKKPYFNDNRNSMVYGVNYERVPLLTGMQAAFLVGGAA